MKTSSKRSKRQDPHPCDNIVRQTINDLSKKNTYKANTHLNQARVLTNWKNNGQIVTSQWEPSLQCYESADIFIRTHPPPPPPHPLYRNSWNSTKTVEVWIEAWIEGGHVVIPRTRNTVIPRNTPNTQNSARKPWTTWTPFRKPGTPSRKPATPYQGCP